MNQIIVDNLGKKYKRYPSRYSRLAEWLSGGKHPRHEEQWALRGLNFAIRSGESIGIVGQNGAGKSTLLKLLTRTTIASEGRLVVNGKVSALLELGLGFHSDFTGRENAVMICQMLGLSQGEIHKLFPEVERFAELNEYMDQPLRVYSTGMQMRLAFSAITAVCPDILLIDEALSVGDIYFQQKCVDRIRYFKSQGTTLMLVSHDMGAIKTLCERTILLDNGLLIKDGPSQNVLDYYNSMIARKTRDEKIQQTPSEAGRTVTRSGTGEAIMQKIEIYNREGNPAIAFQIGEEIEIRCRIKFIHSVVSPSVGILLRDRLGNDVFGANTYQLNIPIGAVKSERVLWVRFFLTLNLGCGNYSLTTAIHSEDTHLQHNYDWWDQCMVFQVLPTDSYRFAGIAALPLRVHVQGESPE